MFGCSDEDQLAGHGLTGSVKAKVDPLPTVLSTEISPPWSSTNRRVSVSPSPVPSCFRAWSVPTWLNASKIFAWSSGAIPAPVSVTDILTKESSRSARTSTRPPSGVNLTALERRLSTTCRTLRSSATKSSRVLVHLEAERDAVASRPLAQEGEGGLKRRRQVEGSQLQLHAPGLHLGQVQDVVDERQQVTARNENVLHVLGLLFIELTEHPLLEHL